MMNVLTYYLIELFYQLRLLHCAYVLYYTSSACMRCFIPSLLPALQESPPGGESQAAVNDEGDSHDSTTHGSLKCIYMQQALRRNSLTHTTYPHIYCTHALVIYTITCYVCTWDTLIYTYSSHNCIAGNRTSAYNKHNTTVCKYVCMYIQLHPLYSSTSLLGNMYLAIMKVISSEGLVL